jgi:hypothetical protein
LRSDVIFSISILPRSTVFWHCAGSMTDVKNLPFKGY